MDNKSLSTHTNTPNQHIMMINLACSSVRQQQGGRVAESQFYAWQLGCASQVVERVFLLILMPSAIIDPMGYLPPSELLEVLDWWIGLSFATLFLKHDLPTGNQINTFSCSILTMNALSHYFFPSEVPFLSHGESCIVECGNVLVAPKMVAVKKRRGNEGIVIIAQKSSAFFDEAKKLRKRERHQKLDLAIVKLFCVTGIPTHVSDLDMWKGLFSAVDPSYMPASRSKLGEVHTIGQAEEIQALQVAYLETQENITVSCDGGTTKGWEAFWTLHMSTVERKAYLMEVREATLESHAGVWIKSFVLEVCRSRICAIVSDSTGNTPLHPELLVQEIPTIFNPPDIVHFISNTIKDIDKLPYFNKPTHHAWRKGLVSIGKTRFGTIIIAAWSLQLNIPSRIKKVVEHGHFDLGDFTTYFREASRSSFEFEFALAQLIKLGLPALKALTCLEANEATVGDIYIFWHAMMWSIKEMLLDPLFEFPENVQEQVLGILNSRHSQIVGDGNLATSADLYLCGAYLNPGLKSDLFQKDSSLTGGIEGICHVSTFKTVVRYLLEVAEKKIFHGHRVSIVQWKGCAKEFKAIFLEEVSGRRAF
ncbi:hypothetical protein BYT27DRAFT_7247457 [Phlegmacium glaucopus]|nr:hypothetical protein BYT27DRAFT_7247457 [Phlegmacium glaucopus]